MVAGAPSYPPQPASAGLLDLLPSGAARPGSDFQGGSFQAVACLCLAVVLLLIRDVGDHPVQLLFPEAHHAETALPLEVLSFLTPVDFVRASAFQVTHHVAYANRRLDRNGQVNVVLGAANGMKEDALRPGTAALDESVNDRLQRGREKRAVAFRMPIEVKVDLVEYVAGHLSAFRGQGLGWWTVRALCGLKANRSRSPAEAGFFRKNICLRTTS